MGFARRIVRKSVRKATPRTVRRAMHPVRTTKNAVTPRPLKQVSRAVYTVTNPLGAAENALIGAALYPRSRRGSHGITHRTSGGRGPGQTSPTAADLRRAEGIASADSLSRITDLGREKFTPSRRPIVQAAPGLDPAPYAASDWAARRGEARIWQRGLRRDIRAACTAAAEAFVEAHAAWSERGRLRRQAVADLWWAALQSGDLEVTADALVAAFSDNAAPVTVVEVLADRAVVLLRLPGPDCLPARMPHVTPGGKISSKAWAKTDFNQIYAELLGAHLVATVREGFAVAPRLQDLRVVGLLSGASVDRSVLFDVRCPRASAWESERDGLRALTVDEGGLIRTGRTKEVETWPETRIPAQLGIWSATPARALKGPQWLAETADPADPEPTFPGSRAVSADAPMDYNQPAQPADLRSQQEAPAEVSSTVPSQPSNLPPANWYPDPHGVARLRYWDGRQWTSHTAP